MDYTKDTLLDGICVEREPSCENWLLEEKDEDKFSATIKDSVVFYISSYMAQEAVVEALKMCSSVCPDDDIKRRRIYVQLGEWIYPN